MTDTAWNIAFATENIGSLYKYQIMLKMQKLVLAFAWQHGLMVSVYTFH